MDYLYFPSCNFTKDSPQAAQKIRAYLKERMPVAACCRVDKLEYPPESIALYFCQACRETLEARVPGKFTLQNLFAYLLEQPDFPWPTVLEMAENREHTTFCGNLHLEPRLPENQALLAQHSGTPLHQLPQDVQARLMREQVSKLPCPLAVTYCNRCKQGILLGGGQAVHLLELATGTFPR